jgi:hypothetical protein
VTEPNLWIEGRRPALPPSLQQEIEAALARHDPGTGSLAERLAGAGIAALGQVASSDQGRQGALPLLAADALITYACEAAAEAEAAGHDGAVKRITGALGPATFTRLLAGDPG